MKYVLLWLGEFFLFVVVLVLLYTFIPEVRIYEIVRSYLGIIPDYTWGKYYFLSICIISLLMVSVVIFITTLIKKR